MDYKEIPSGNNPEGFVMLRGNRKNYFWFLRADSSSVILARVFLSML